MNKTKLRPGQQAALDIVLSRIAARESHTSIVLPTRYGKSDLIRLVALLSIQDGTSSGHIALSPITFLQNQLVRPDKLEDMASRYGLDSNTIKMRVMESANQWNPFSNGEQLLSATTQLATLNMELFRQLADHQMHITGLPLVFHIDECHETAENKKRGELVARLTDGIKGALVILYTATAIRADGEIIPGFRMEVLNREDARRYIVTDAGDGKQNRIDVFGANKLAFQLDADHITSFQEAWDEQPSPLCNLSREVIEVNLSDLSEGDETIPLSSCSPSRARRYLSKAVRNPVVIQRAVQLFLRELGFRQKVNPDAAGIIFTCSDINGVSNEHARQIVAEIKEVDAEMVCCIVTMKSDDDAKAAKQIERFAGTDTKPGVGDVLLVKQMGGAGLDSARIKVVLDLSPVRTIASVIQRLMRVATPWDQMRTGTVITLADPHMEAIWKGYVAEAGGVVPTSTAYTEWEWLEFYLKDKEPPPPDVIIEIHSADVSRFDNNFGEIGDLETLPMVNELISRIPRLLDLHTKPELSNRLSGFVITPSSATVRSWSLDETIAKKQQLIFERLKNLANMDVNYSEERAAWVERFKFWTNAAKSAAGIPLNVKLEHIVNASTLDIMLNFLAR